MRELLESLKRSFLTPIDEVLVVDTGCTDGGVTVETCLRYGARVVDGTHLKRDIGPMVKEWCPEALKVFGDSDLTSGCILSFAEARQLACDEAKNDIQFWIDSDDILYEKKPGQLRSAVERVFTKQEANSIFLDYLYAFDAKDGSLTSIHKRERIYDRRLYYWAGRCHETAIPKPGVLAPKAAYFADMETAILHKKPRPEVDKIHPCDIRNYVIIRNELEEDFRAGNNPDPRTVFYMGNAARGLQRDAEAITFYKQLLERSGSRDDRFAAAYYIAGIMVGGKARRPADGLDWYFQCIQIKPEDPRGYFGLARAYFQLHRHQEARHWFKVGRTLPSPDQSLHNFDPRHINVLPFQMEALASKELGDEQGAIDAVNELTANSPNHPETKDVQSYIGNWIAGRKLVDSVDRLVMNAQPRDRDEARRVGLEVTRHLKEIPEELEDKGLAKPEPEDTRAGHDLVFFCGKAPEPWGPDSGKAGIGGSEKAVINMAKRMATRGFRVTVFANVPVDQRGDRDGVRWLHFGSFDFKRPRGTLILWRTPEALELPCPAERRILWCHDVQDQARWNDVRVQLADEVWVLSEYHATTLGKWREKLGSKLRITRNGIDSAFFRSLAVSDKECDWHSSEDVVYSSSPDRGVLTAILGFKRAKEEKRIDPEAKLHICYGFTKMYLKQAAKHEYAHIPDIGREIHMWDYWKKVLQTVDNSDDIVWHGRIGWEDLAKLMRSCRTWLYPTRFPEISCMSAMEAQAMGCHIVATDTAALKETILWGRPGVYLVDPTSESIALGLGDARRELSQQDVREEALHKFDYETLADEWKEILLVQQKTVGT